MPTPKKDENIPPEQKLVLGVPVEKTKAIFAKPTVEEERARWNQAISASPAFAKALADFIHRHRQ